MLTNGYNNGVLDDPAEDTVEADMLHCLVECNNPATSHCQLGKHSAMLAHQNKHNTVLATTELPSNRMCWPCMLLRTFDRLRSVSPNTSVMSTSTAPFSPSSMSLVTRYTQGSHQQIDTEEQPTQPRTSQQVSHKQHVRRWHDQRAAC
jgi:hypothetical protein